MTTNPNPASEPQVNFLRSLLRDRDCDALLAGAGVTAQQFLDAVSTDKAACSKAISTLKNLGYRKVAANGAPAARANGYAGTCTKCGQRVEAGAGLLTGTKGNWTTEHKAGECPLPTVSAPAAATRATLDDLGIYVLPDNRIVRVYETQNGRPGGKVLVVGADGRGSFHYAKGMADVAVSTGHKMTEAEAQAFGREHGFCCACARDLTDDRSLAAGYGPVCARKWGWYFPTYDEAAVILNRPVVAGEADYSTDGSMFTVVGGKIVDVEDDDDTEGCEDCADPADVIPGVVCHECRMARMSAGAGDWPTSQRDEEPF